MKCGFCTKTEMVDVVCHHCGTPLCPEHRHPRTNDPIFLKRTSFGERTRGLIRRQPMATPEAPVIAYHCSNCVHTPAPTAQATQP